ncbi:hypothetical protein T492DRAFT_846394 [Pavlovales sp. CCMP2436]|nr:hypothetical protein T492DRAFT_846394 [Pavlovales sp. CCMP2436]
MAVSLLVVVVWCGVGGSYTSACQAGAQSTRTGITLAFADVAAIVGQAFALIPSLPALKAAAGLNTPPPPIRCQSKALRFSPQTRGVPQATLAGGSDRGAQILAGGTAQEEAGGALFTATSWEATLVCIGSMCALYGVCAFVLLTASTAQQAQSEDLWPAAIVCREISLQTNHDSALSHTHSPRSPLH